MAKEYSADNPKCKSGDHSKHLCHIVSQGDHIHKTEEYRALVEEPKFQCHFCGRTAHVAENLCMPMDL